MNKKAVFSQTAFFANPRRVFSGSGCFAAHRLQFFRDRNLLIFRSSRISYFVNSLSSIFISVLSVGSLSAETATKETRHTTGITASARDVFIDPELKLLPYTREKGAKYGYLDGDASDWVIRPQFDYANPFMDRFDTTAVKLNDRYGLIDKTGRFILPPKFDRAKAMWFDDKPYFLIRKDKKSGIVDHHGNWMFQTRFDKLLRSSRFVGVTAKSNGKYGVVDIHGAPIIDFEFDELGSFSENGLAKAKKGKLWGYIDASGDWAISPEYQSAGNFYQGRAKIKLKGKYGFIDSDGARIIAAKYESASGFHYGNGLATVKLDGKEGIIDTDGRIVVPLRSGDINLGSNWFSKRANPLQGIKDLKDNWISKPTYSSAYMSSNDIIRFYIGDLQGCMTKAGDIRIPAVFSSANCYGDPPYRVWFNENTRSGYVSGHGVPFQFAYDDLEVQEKTLCNKDADTTPLLSYPSGKSGRELARLLNGKVVWLVDTDDFGPDNAPFAHVAISNGLGRPKLSGFVPKRALSSECDLFAAQSNVRFIRKAGNKTYRFKEKLSKRSAFAPGKTVPVKYIYAVDTKDGRDNTLDQLCHLRMSFTREGDGSFLHDGGRFTLNSVKQEIEVDFAKGDTNLNWLTFGLSKPGSTDFFGHYQHGHRVGFSATAGKPISENSSVRRIYVDGKLKKTERFGASRELLSTDVPPDADHSFMRAISMLDDICNGANDF